MLSCLLQACIKLFPMVCNTASRQLKLVNITAGRLGQHTVAELCCRHPLAKEADLLQHAYGGYDAGKL